MTYLLIDCLTYTPHGSIASMITYRTYLATEGASFLPICCASWIIVRWVIITYVQALSSYSSVQSSGTLSQPSLSPP